MNKVTLRAKRLSYYFLYLLGFGAALGVNTSHSSAQTPNQELAEIACRDALRENTIEAIEEFLLRYPDADTACKALALDALNNFTGSEEERGDSGVSGGGYQGLE